MIDSLVGIETSSLKLISFLVPIDDSGNLSNTSFPLESDLVRSEEQFSAENLLRPTLGPLPFWNRSLSSFLEIYDRS